MKKSRDQRHKPPRKGSGSAPTRSTPASGQAARSHLVQIEKPIYGGAFLARVEGKATFVPLTLPGEEARIRIVEEKRSYATAEVEAVTRAAPERIAAACRHFGFCGGCNYQHASYDAQVAFKQAILRETLDRAKVTIPAEIGVLKAEPWEYRNRIRLAMDAEGRLGYRGRRSHSIVAMEECPIAAPLLARAALAAGELLCTWRDQIQAREITLFCNRSEDQLLVQILVQNDRCDRLDEFARALAERIPALTGIEMSREGREGEFPRSIARWGRNSLIYRAAGFDYRVDQGAFFQVNRWLVDELVTSALADDSDGPHGIAWDLFAGVGLFARQLTSRYEQVIAVESAPTARQALDANLQGTSGMPVYSTSLDFLRKAGRSERPDRVVVDPPRTGLDAETVSILTQIAPPALTYVSCDPATLARDLKALIGTGYEARSITIADLFPQTFHLETVVQLRR